MKTLYKTYTNQQARAKQIELQEKTGLKWDTYHVGDGMRFTAVITKETPTNSDLAQKLYPILSRVGYSFTKLAELSGMKLSEVLIAAKTLVQQQQGIAVVNRMGNFAGIRRTQ